MNDCKQKAKVNQLVKGKKGGSSFHSPGWGWAGRVGANEVIMRRWQSSPRSCVIRGNNMEASNQQREEDAEHET